MAAGLAQAAPARQFHRWVVETLLPAVRNAAQPAAQPTHTGHALAEIVRQRLGQRRQSLAVINCTKLLAHLADYYPDGQWREIRKLALAQVLEMDARSLGRALDRLVEWGFVGRKPEAQSAWPSEIRLNRANVQAALDESG